MDELGFVVGGGCGDQQMQIGFPEPLEKVASEVLHPAGGRCHMKEPLAAVDANTGAAEAAGIVGKFAHWKGVGRGSDAADRGAAL